MARSDLLLPVATDVGVPPAHLWVPDHTSTAGEEAADFAEMAGMQLDDEQRLVLDVTFAERADGKWAALETGLIAARQNIKTFSFEAIVLTDLYLFDSDFIVWTAHEFNTSNEAFRNIKVRLESYDHLRRHVHKVTEANGEEGIEFRFKSGLRRLRFKARTKTGGRGLTGHRVILDEAFALTPSMVGSLMPTLSAMSVEGNPQINYGSSAGKPESAVLRSLRDRGRPGGDPALSYLEWCAPTGGCALERCDHRVGNDGCALDDPAKWKLANPAMGRRISEEFIRAERRSMTPIEFARERLGWWEDPDGSASGLPSEDWGGCRDRNSQIETVKAFAYDVAHDRSWSAIGVAGLRGDGVPHIEVVEYRPGTDWVAERSVELAQSHGVGIFYAAKSPAEAIADDVIGAGVNPIGLSPQEFVLACGVLANGVTGRSLRHLGQPELDMSVRGAARREVGDAWAWSRRMSSVEIAPLVAVTVALAASSRTITTPVRARVVNLAEALAAAQAAQEAE